MGKTKVLQCGLSYKAGGIENFLINYLEFLNQEEVQCDFINVFEKAKSEQFYQTIKQKSLIYDLPDYRKHPLKFYKKLKEVQSKRKYDIFHYNMNSAAYIWPLIAAKLVGFHSIIAHAHNSSSDKGAIKEILHYINKIFIKIFANKYFACSEKAGEWFFSKKIIESNDFKIIHNAINVDKFVFSKETRERKRKELNIDENAIVIGNVGRLKKQKNHDFLIDVFYEISKLEKNAVLVIVGYGPLEDELKNKIKSLELEEKVKLLGQRTDVSELMSMMDIFILPSLYEGLPVVGIEAQCAGNLCYFSDTITKETKVIDKTQFLSLDVYPKGWATNILHKYEYYKDSKSTNIEKNIEESGYNVKIEATKLCDFYKELIENNNRERKC